VWGWETAVAAPVKKKTKTKNRNLPVVDKGQFHLALKGPTAAQSQSKQTNKQTNKNLLLNSSLESKKPPLQTPKSVQKEGEVCPV